MTKTIICKLQDLVSNSGVCVKIDDQQVALFYLPDESPKVYAIGNWDPIGKANVLSRGILGCIAILFSSCSRQRFREQPTEAIPQNPFRRSCNKKTN